jgi:hypothetical protein
VKNSVLILFFTVAAGCATPMMQPAVGGADLAPLSGVGGSGGGDGDMAIDVGRMEPPPEGADLSTGAGADLAVALIPDMAQPPTPDMAQPPIPDMAQPLCVHNTPSSTCGVFPQCGCNAGQMCNIEDANGKALCSVAGTTPPYGACGPNDNGDGTCVAGTTCVNGTCMPFCGGNGDCSNGVCVGVTSGGTAIPGMQVCTLNCDPQNPSTASGSYGACGSGTRCMPSTDRNTYCESPTKAAGTQDKACNDDSGCAPGFTCQGAGYCSKYCKVGVSGQCAGTTCYAFSPKQYAGTIQFGYCY